ATIAPLDLGPHPDAGGDELVGTLVPPAQPFRVAVSGVDADGYPYERLFPRLFRAQAVEVTARVASRRLPAGATTTIPFAVHNIGQARTLDVVVTDSAGFVARVEPARLELGPETIAVVEVDVAVPADAARGTPVTITAVATDGDVTNSASVVLSV